jgi:drug/metabolite transporter (DMT)-like permease
VEQGVVDDAGGDAGQVLTLTPVGGFVLSMLIFGGTPSATVVASIALIAGGIFVTLRR